MELLRCHPMLQEPSVDLLSSKARQPFADFICRSHAQLSIAVIGVAQRFDQFNI